jgi:dihydropteroate synthase
MLDLPMLAALHDAHREQAALPVADFALGPHRFDFARQRYLMGVINLSPDSWYRESVALDADAAIRRAHILHAQGAALVDLGAESSLPHAARADAAAQLDLLLPVVRPLARAGLCVSVETYDLEVAASVLEAGARVINFTGTSGADELFRLVAQHEAAVILCFVRGENVREAGEVDLERDSILALHEFFEPRVAAAVTAGVSRLWLDPGLGFYYRNLPDGPARVRHQLRVFLESFRLRALGWPICQALPHAFACFGEEVRTAEAFFAVPALQAMELP